MEWEFIMDANNITVDKLSHASNTYRDNENNIFTSEKLDKSNELDYESNVATASDAKVDLT